MKMRLDEIEIARALKVYWGAKTNVAPELMRAQIHWRGKFAEVETPRPIPTLTVAVIAGDK